ncbi:MAG: nucleoside hydrolase [Desulfohalobiaceae bacterium]
MNPTLIPSQLPDNLTGMQKSVLIDTDPGVDDALALLLALNSDKLQVKAITTVCGNVDVQTATANLQRVLQQVSGPYPILAQGASQALSREPFFAGHVHGADGLGGTQSRQEHTLGSSSTAPTLSARSAAEEILCQTANSPGPLSLITLGPLTNIALALQQDPDLPSKIQEMIIMGGAYTVPGNITPAAEFNIYVDPEAADLVFRSGINITAVGLDVTRQVRVQRQELQHWVQAQDTHLRRSIQAWTRHSLDFMQDLTGEASMPLHDPLAVLICMYPDLVKTAPMHVEVETKGEHTQGMTLADLRPILGRWKKEPNIQVCTWVDSRQSLKLFWEEVA